MRIVGGRLGGRRFPAPPGIGTRPTTERVREAVASRLASRGALEGSRVLDLFAGSGALAFEALSRGARSAVLVDRDRRVVAGARRAAADLGLEGQVAVVAHDLLGRPEALAPRLPRGLGDDGAFGLVFVDPPYAALGGVPELLACLDDAGLLAEGAAVVVEHAARDPLPAFRENLALDRTARYGDSAVSLLWRTGPWPGRAAGPGAQDASLP